MQEAARCELGEFIQTQRQIANLSIRQLARLTGVSDSYLSQVERGLYRPSAEVLKAVGEGLGIRPVSCMRS
jgi:transcriptional regulator with XRE-family HTH domain